MRVQGEFPRKFNYFCRTLICLNKLHMNSIIHLYNKILLVVSRTIAITRENLKKVGVEKGV